MRKEKGRRNGEKSKKSSLFSSLFKLTTSTPSLHPPLTRSQLALNRFAAEGVRHASQLAGTLREKSNQERKKSPEALSLAFFFFSSSTIDSTRFSTPCRAFLLPHASCERRARRGLEPGVENKRKEAEQGAIHACAKDKKFRRARIEKEAGGSKRRSVVLLLVLFLNPDLPPPPPSPLFHRKPRPPPPLTQSSSACARSRTSRRSPRP